MNLQRSNINLVYFNNKDFAIIKNYLVIIKNNENWKKCDLGNSCSFQYTVGVIRHWE